MRYQVRNVVIASAAPVDLDGIHYVVFSDGERVHTVAADVFDLFYEPVGENDAVPVVPGQAPKPKPRWKARRRLSGEEKPMPPTWRELGKLVQAEVAARVEPDLNAQIVAALKAKPMDMADEI